VKSIGTFCRKEIGRIKARTSDLEGRASSLPRRKKPEGEKERQSYKARKDLAVLSGVRGTGLGWHHRMKKGERRGGKVVLVGDCLLVFSDLVG